MVTLILAALWLLSLAAVPHVLLARKRPAATLAWVWGILLFPGLGAVMYFAVGADRMRRRRLRKAARANLPRFTKSSEAENLLLSRPPKEAQMLRLLSMINEAPVSTTASAQLLFDAHQFYPSLLQSIRDARDHVHLEFFIWRADECGDEFLQSLADAARRGVEVRLLLDQIGCWGVSKRNFASLIEAGGKMAWFYSLPLWRHSRFMNLRNHRKLQVVDGKVAFVGGMNIGREYLGLDPELGRWRDAQVRLVGQVANSLQEVFATDWFFATDERLVGERYFLTEIDANPKLTQVLAGGPDLPREPMPKTLIALLNMAERRVWISTGYFVPDTLMLTTLQLTAARGVDVRLLVSARTDHPMLLQVGRSFYEDLLPWGVRVFEYDGAFIHRKAMLYDNEWFMVGSANSDNRSMRLNFELGVLVHAPDEAHRLETVMNAEFAGSKEIEMKRFLARSFKRRVLEAAFRPLAPLL